MDADALSDGHWRRCLVTGSEVGFSAIGPDDDYLHPAAPDAHFTLVETNLYGFNIPAADINCNIYALWHPVLGTMSCQIWVTKGREILSHQLQADYFLSYEFLPTVADNRDWQQQLGTCTVRMRVVRPLEEMRIEFTDPARDFALDLSCTAAMPPVGRPGGKHFTQLLKTGGKLRLDGADYAIDGFYMRDRSWGYNRPEHPERTPPYRWMTGWFGADAGFVVAWLDTGLLDGDEFGPNWNQAVTGPESSGANKWEHGGATPSLNLRSGWIARAGKPVPVTQLDFRTLTAGDSRLLVKAVELDITDADGQVTRVEGQTRSMIPKLYWQNIVTYMHGMALTSEGRSGNGDLMDSYTADHVRAFGL